MFNPKISIPFVVCLLKTWIFVLLLSGTLSSSQVTCADNIMVSLDVALPPGIIILESGCQHGGAEVNET